MEKAIRRYNCPPEIKADALQEALLKVFFLLDKMWLSRKFRGNHKM